MLVTWAPEGDFNQNLMENPRLVDVARVFRYDVQSLCHVSRKR